MNLVELRKSKGLSPSFVRQKLGIVSPKHFWRIETGQGYLTKERIEILAKLYGCKKSEIVEASKECREIHQALDDALNKIKEVS